MYLGVSVTCFLLVSYDQQLKLLVLSSIEVKMIEKLL